MSIQLLTFICHLKHCFALETGQNDETFISLCVCTTRVAAQDEPVTRYM